jgi:hypothetical protein
MSEQALNGIGVPDRKRLENQTRRLKIVHRLRERLIIG